MVAQLVKKEVLVLWSLKVHCCAYMGPLLDSVLGQLNPFHKLTSYFFKIKFNIILTSIPRSPN